MSMQSKFVEGHRGEVALRIMSGMHEGASVALQENTPYRIGSDTHGDIVVRDEGIAAHQVTLKVSKGHVRLESHADHVQIHGKLTVPAGHLCESRLPCAFSIGPVRMSIVSERTGRVVGAKRLRANVLLPALAVLTMLFAYFLLPASGKTNDVLAETAPADTHASKRIPAGDAVRRQLVARLNESGLSGLEVQVDGNVVQVRGALSDQQKAPWRDVQTWFDQHYGSSYLMRATLSVAVGPTLIIAAVWLGASPYLVDDGGVRRYPGAILDKGWVLKSISKKNIVLTRNGQEHIFRLG